MNAETLRCPMCGALAGKDATRCEYCEARLATVACPSCFSMMFLGTRHCPYCGAEASSVETVSPIVRLCPRCSLGMKSITVGASSLLECMNCNGLWVDASSFEKICNDREQQSAMLGAAIPAQVNAPEDSVPRDVRYVPCPDCRQLMNRVNFAHCSGVIVDICKEHGTWFDRDELRHIVEFIYAGGLQKARLREKQELNEERQKLRADKLAFEASKASFPDMSGEQDRRTGAIAAAGGLLKMLLG